MSWTIALGLLLVGVGCGWCGCCGRHRILVAVRRLARQLRDRSDEDLDAGDEAAAVKTVWLEPTRIVSSIGRRFSGHTSGGGDATTGWTVQLEGSSSSPYILNNGQATFIGRSPEADIELTDTRVSRKHVRLVLEGNSIEVRDEMSTHGTYISGRPITRTRMSGSFLLELGQGGPRLVVASPRVGDPRLDETRI